jgi:pimeloyl-ACP methyl ester carboxylesterase
MPQKKATTKAATTTPTVSGRWILAAAGLAIAAAVVCSWGVLCLLFWQGSWQLLYRPKAEVTRTPASVGLAFDSIGLATSEAGEARLRGWWIPAGAEAHYGRYTVLCLHGQDGNLSDTVEGLAALHSVGVNVLAFDYRGYGQSQFAKPSEAHWREDAESALKYLTGTRHVDAGSIVLDGRELGANLALEMAAQHTELAGVILRGPQEAPVQAIFTDARARLVPAHALVQDRFDLNGPAAQLRIPSLWFYETAAQGQAGLPAKPDAFQKAAGPKMLVWLTGWPYREKDGENVLARWLDDLPNRGRNLPVCQFGSGFAC